MVMYVLAIMFFVAGVVIAGVGYHDVVKARSKRATWVAVDGTIVDFVEREQEASGKGQSRTLHAPVYRYVVDGEQYTATSKAAFHIGDYQVGETVPVLFNPLKPNDSDLALPSGGCAQIVFGVLVFGLGVLLVYAVLTGRVTPAQR
jgi:hypothetical protein